MKKYIALITLLMSPYLLHATSRAPVGVELLQKALASGFINPHLKEQNESHLAMTTACVQATEYGAQLTYCRHDCLGHHVLEAYAGFPVVRVAPACKFEDGQEVITWLKQTRRATKHNPADIAE